VRALNAVIAVALSAFILASYWPLVQLLDLSRADLQYEDVWIGGPLPSRFARRSAAPRAGRGLD
jgi:hypothetical protein